MIKVVHHWQDSTLGTWADEVKSAWTIRIEMFNEMDPEKFPQLIPDGTSRLVKVDRWERVPKSWDSMKVKVSRLICSCCIMYKFAINRRPSGARREVDILLDIK